MLRGGRGSSIIREDIQTQTRADVVLLSMRLDGMDAHQRGSGGIFAIPVEDRSVLGLKIIRSCAVVSHTLFLKGPARRPLSLFVCIFDTIT